jgi:translocation and assembly module TamB
VEDDLATATITGFLGGDRAVLDAEAAAALPFDDWVQRGGVDEFPSTELVARVRGADMASVPWLCSYGRGPINGSLTAKDLLTGTSVVGAVVNLPRFQLWEADGDHVDPQLSTDYRVHVRAGSTPERDALSACVILGAAGNPGTPGSQCRAVAIPSDGELLARLRVPVEWTPGRLLPAYQEGGVITSVTDFERVHVEPMLALVPGIVTGDAVMDGTVSVRGPWEAIRLEGGLELNDGRVQIEGLGQHLSGIAGRLELRGTEVLFPRERPLTARDAGGLASAHGRVGFRGLVPSTLALNVRADAFPIRNEGMVLAWLTGDASIDGEITDERTTSSIRTRDFTVRLPERTASSLQPLGAHPEILIVGAERPVATGVTESDYPVVIGVDARDPFWVRRSDFAAQVSARLNAIYRDPNLYVGGEATIRRGTFEIFGKRFELQPGSTITFNEAEHDLNPEVNITANYDVPGRANVTVTVTVTGTLTNPELAFSSTETSDRAEIIALLISGGRRDTGGAEREASEQAASFLAGLTAGILTLGLRQEFGDVIPVLAVESEGAGGTRIRVGWNADDIIPDFLSDFVLGAYIEGFVTAAGEGAATTGPAGVGGGVSLEFTLPQGFLLRGTYVPVDNGSLDLLFEP